MTRPVDKLVAPEAVQAFPGPIDSVLSVNDWLSLSHWMMKAVELVTGGAQPRCRGRQVVRRRLGGLRQSR